MGNFPKKEVSHMSKKKTYFLRFAAFLLAISPFMIEAHSFFAFVGEPELPAKYKQQ